MIDVSCFVNGDCVFSWEAASVPPVGERIWIRKPETYHDPLCLRVVRRPGVELHCVHDDMGAPP